MFVFIRIKSKIKDSFNKVQRYFFNSIYNKKAPQNVRLLKYLIRV